MSIGFLFWFFWLLCLILAVYWNRGPLAEGRYGVPGVSLFVLVMLFLIGWRLFGFPIQG